jgi:hypothetical protein
MRPGCLAYCFCSFTRGGASRGDGTGNGDACCGDLQSDGGGEAGCGGMGGAVGYGGVVADGTA